MENNDRSQKGPATLDTEAPGVAGGYRKANL